MRSMGQAGFTLVELLVAAAVLALFMAGLYQAVTFGLTSWERSQFRVDVQQNVRTAINHVSRELRTAESFEILHSGSSIRIEIPGGAEIRYYLSGEQFLREVEGSGHNIVAYGIKAVNFAESAEGDVVEIEIEGVTGYKLRTQVFIRALSALLVPSPVNARA